MSLLGLIVAKTWDGLAGLAFCGNYTEHCYPGRAIIFLAVTFRKQRVKRQRDKGIRRQLLAFGLAE
jgi:hypothetical protein